MSRDTLPLLVETLEKGQLLEPEQLEQVRSELGPTFLEPRRLLVELVRRGWLTTFQANQLSKGKGAELVLGQYVLLDQLGEGGMGQVFKARHRLMNRVVALKIIRPDHLANPAALRRFRQEIQAAARVSHPNIVLAHDADEVDGKHFLTMEFVEGTDLGKLVKQQGPLPVRQACDYIRQAALGLQHAHELGMVHRDIKPSNVLVTQTQGRESVGLVKILDLGLARLRKEGSNELTQPGAVMGSADYIAPEQANDAHRADIRADIYGLGCTLYFLLAGEPPFPHGTAMEKLFAHLQGEPEPIEQRRADVPPGLVPVLRRMMAKQPEARYQAPLEVVQVLEPFCHHGQIQVAAPAPAPVWPLVAEPAQPPSSSETSSLPIRLPPRRRWPLAAAAGTFGLICLVAAAVVLGRRGPAQRAGAGPTNSRWKGTALLPSDASFTNSLGMKLVRIPAGKFLMGSPPGEQHYNENEAPQHQVTISKPFYLGAHEVTVANFRAFVQETNYVTDPEQNRRGALRYYPDKEINGKKGVFLPDPDCTWRTPGWPQEDDYPVVGVSWNDARAFCAWLTEKERNRGRTYRLPTEAEWEYACRAGTTTRYSFGEALSSFQANFNGQFPRTDSPRGPNRGRPTRVGSFSANPWGLFDMHGNVTEWVADFYTERYSPQPQTDPTGPKREDANDSRVYRGGSWFDPGNLCRSPARGKNPEYLGLTVIGFRVACTVKP